MHSRIFYHARLPKSVSNAKLDMHIPVYTNRNNPVFTIGFHYDEANNVLFIGWAKPNKGEKFNKKFGISVVNSRLELMLQHYPDLNYGDKLPHVIKDNMKFYIGRALNYFKSIDETTCKFFI